MVSLEEIRKKIIEVLKNRGPSLPIQISRDIGLNSLFISAFLSELVNEKKIKMSNLKVGGSPLYFLEGQEKELEKFHNHLHPKEIEAFRLLREKRILKDSRVEPSIRVALRAIKDFAIPFQKNNELYWKYAFAPIETKKEVKEKLKISEKVGSEIKEEKKEIKPITVSNEFKNPLVESFKESLEKKKKREKPKSEFVVRVIDFLKKKSFEIVEEKDYKAKEYNCLLKVESRLGDLIFMTKAKDKKLISETDLKKFLAEAQSIPLPAFFIYTGELSKKAKEFAERYFSVLKVMKL